MYVKHSKCYVVNNKIFYIFKRLLYTFINTQYLRDQNERKLVYAKQKRFQ